MKAELRKLNEVLVKSYDHESEDVPRSKDFNRAYGNLIKAVIKGSGWEVATKSTSYCYYSAFLKNSEGKYVHIITEDFRYGRQDSWLNSILVRTAKHDRDYTGGSNNYTSITDLVSKANSLTR